MVASPGAEAPASASGCVSVTSRRDAFATGAAGSAAVADATSADVRPTGPATAPEVDSDLSGATTTCGSGPSGTVTANVLEHLGHLVPNRPGLPTLIVNPCWQYGQWMAKEVPLSNRAEVPCDRV